MPLNEGNTPPLRISPYLERLYGKCSPEGQDCMIELLAARANRDIKRKLRLSGSSNSASSGGGWPDKVVAVPPEMRGDGRFLDRLGKIDLGVGDDKSDLPASNPEY